MAEVSLSTTCAIVGGGPAGMMLGFLLARAGIDVVVLEKHGDFLRDFRGDTIHPSTLELMYELGLLDDFLKLPHQKAPTLTAQFGDLDVTMADFSHLPVHGRYIALIPQWDFLNFLAERAKRFAGFRLFMQAEAIDLIEQSGRVVGLRASTAGGPVEIRARLVVGCDGRHSTIRDKARLEVQNFGAPIDVLWFRISRRADDPAQLMGRFGPGHIAVMLQRGDYWQCAFVISKGSMEKVKSEGLPAFRARLAVALAPFLRDRVEEIADWDQVKLLTVLVDRLKRWHRPGLICIGDAAHAMSPVGGVGINLAVQDAVATGNILADPLRRGDVDDDDLQRVQRRRELPTRLTQRLQLVLQNRVIKGALDSTQAFQPPWFVRLLAKFAFLRRIPARLIGMGFRPEHVRIV